MTQNEAISQDCTMNNESMQEQQNSLSQEPVINADTVFKCPQCRYPLFKGSDIIQHEATKVRKIVKKRKQYASKENGCHSYFIDKPDWLDATGRLNDTINCPRCHIKLGHFNWYGSQCSCGEWIKPSFQFPKSRVDAI
ncbi:dual specificity protein phosphatase, putative [Trichomonas vaginalis G3]|uniref:protein-tyrosine-phosphatase n=1 Tax=Trichomonas vaginalis (strain ATCC PRA-98 / G3) TaxID=412133 RepID=A2F1Y7_TRIV3|nr:protein tyrosine/serine/threonine phosphatase protein [Trichomonas vaginalis G3]EAY01085.1 dual specificity protein phosphatase, putative [Trichomonas vaginalis G3]KAI5545914.1 protein tyrosine/serine/threonine phosphatase protein [Trichomonas vaginalis G3]|eukprot:XP_001330101.1 dual specificity protein phosphatase [Trichomonas vaginalis G3]